MAKKTNLSYGTTNSGGSTANTTGFKLEDFVRNILEGEDYHDTGGEKTEKQQAFANRQSIGGKQYAQQVMVGPTIYGTERYVDFAVYNPDIFPHALIIECKWQQAGGSVDEKYPFLCENIDLTGVPTIVVLDGGGYKPGAKDWLVGQVEERTMLVGVFSMNEFLIAVNKGLFRQPLADTLKSL